MPQSAQKWSRRPRRLFPFTSANSRTPTNLTPERIPPARTGGGAIMRILQGKPHIPVSILRIFRGFHHFIPRVLRIFRGKPHLPPTHSEFTDSPIHLKAAPKT